MVTQGGSTVVGYQVNKDKGRLFLALICLESSVGLKGGVGGGEGTLI